MLDWLWNIVSSLNGCHVMTNRETWTVLPLVWWLPIPTVLALAFWCGLYQACSRGPAQAVSQNWGAYYSFGDVQPLLMYHSVQAFLSMADHKLILPMLTDHSCLIFLLGPPFPPSSQVRFRLFAYLIDILRLFASVRRKCSN